MKNFFHSRIVHSDCIKRSCGLMQTFTAHYMFKNADLNWHLDTSCRYDSQLYTIEPWYNEPLYNKVLGIMNNIFCPSYSKIYGKEPQYNETLLYQRVFASPLALAISKFHCKGFIFQNNNQLINRINGGILDLAKTWERISSVTLIHINRHPRELGLLPEPTVHIFIAHGIFI